MKLLLWAPPGLLLLSTACFGADEPQYALLEPQPGRLSIGAVQQLETTREPGTPPATVYARLELSEYAVERFLQLDAIITVSGAGSLKGQGVRAEWLGEPGGLPIVGQFEDELSTIWSAYLVPNPCTQPTCVLSFELTPEGNGELNVSPESTKYELRTWLQVRGQYRSEYQALDSALTISLEEAP